MDKYGCTRDSSIDTGEPEDTNADDADGSEVAVSDVLAD